MKTILWALAILSITIFLFYLFSFLYVKWNLYRLGKRINKMADKYDGETKQSLKDLAKAFEEANRNQTL